ncbi:hypothetical protein GCM10025859_55830 [Alicyclobacillus fastidiosus]|nr:hypothetical protein GCM10025859_55830 [Alicyclobacillus fastidiosus]
MSENDHQISVMVVNNRDPRITKIEEYSPTIGTVEKSISTNQPLVLSWNEIDIFRNGLELYALSMSGKRLYQYGVQKRGNEVFSGSKWYPVMAS